MSGTNPLSRYKQSSVFVQAAQLMVDYRIIVVVMYTLACSFLSLHFAPLVSLTSPQFTSGCAHHLVRLRLQIGSFDSDVEKVSNSNVIYDLWGRLNLESRARHY
jgi:hypothetical protein